MTKPAIDSLTKEDILLRVKQDKKALLAEKSAQVKYTDAVICTPSTKPVAPLIQKLAAVDSEGLLKKSSVDVTIVCNAAWFCDSQLDVIIDTAYNDSVKNKGTLIPHIADHKQSSTAHVGDVTALYTKNMQLQDLGLDQVGSTTVLIMESTVRADYNDDVFKFYSNGKINQHSIGLRYTDLVIAINNNTEDYKEEKAIWDEYYPRVINKDTVDKTGYFWVVKNMDIIENSCVLFGANSLTPTLSVKSLEEEAIKQPTSTNKSEQQNISTQHKGINMTLEEALAENIRLSSELQAAKGAQALAVAKAQQDEQTRVLGILEAADTFGIPSVTTIKTIKAGTSVENTVTMFEAVKEAIQLANPSPDATTATKTTTPNVVDKKEGEGDSYKSSLMSAFDELDKQQPLFKEIK